MEDDFSFKFSAEDIRWFPAINLAVLNYRTVLPQSRVAWWQQQGEMVAGLDVMTETWQSLRNTTINLLILTWSSHWGLPKSEGQGFL